MNKPIFNKAERSKIYDYIIEEYESIIMNGSCSKYVENILNDQANKKAHKLYWKNQLITFILKN